MLYLINALSTPMTVALLLGITIGWTNVYRDTGQASGNSLALAFLLFAMGCFAASIHLIPGRPGLYLEMTLFLFASYIAGCAIGHVLHKFFPRQFTAGTDTGAVYASSPSVSAATGRDDLSLIWGVGDKLATKLNTMGYERFEQIANWTADDIVKFESHSPEFRGRVDRDQWIEQCKRLAGGWRPDNAVGERLPND